MIDISLIIQSLPFLLRGAWISLQIASLSSFIGLVLGTVLGVGQSSNNKILRYLIFVYVTLFRGTPMLLQIIFLFYVLPQIGIILPDFWCAVVAIGLNSAAYISQTIRSGIRAVNQGQLDAAYVLGLSRFQTIRYIVLPQAFRVVLPSLTNEFTTLVKDSSLAMIIGVNELSKEGSIIRSRTFDAFSIFTMVALIYLFMTTCLSLFFAWFERKVQEDV